MSTTTLIVVIAVAAVVVIALTVAMWSMARRRHLQNQFGPEYDRTVEAEGGRMAAERELRAREQRHDKLEIKELPADRRDRYATEWSTVQEHFVDRPEGSVEEADELVSRLMRERGTPRTTTAAGCATSRSNTAGPWSTTGPPTTSRCAAPTSGRPPRNSAGRWCTTAPCSTTC